MIKNNPKILVIRFSSIGDVILTTPVVRCLHRQLGAEVHFLVKKAFSTLLSENPHVFRLHLFDGSWQEMIADLGRESFDYIIDLQGNLRSLRIKRALKVPSQTFNKINVAKWLKVNFKLNLLPPLHIVDRYLASAAILGIENDGAGLDVYFSPQDLNLPDRPYTVLVIGGAHATKRLPIQQLMKICSGIKSKVVLVGGGRHDIETSKRIEGACPEVVNFVGQVDLHGSMQIIDQATLVISHDTGMMHVAAALNKTILSIWGNTIPAFGMYPYFPKGSAASESHVAFEVPGLGCRPCSKIGFEQCPKGHFRCMQLQDIDGLVRKANAIVMNLS